MRSLPTFAAGVLTVTLLVPTAGAQTPAVQRDEHPSGSGARGIAAADFNRDGWIDIVTAHNDPDGLWIQMNRGAGGGYRGSFIALPGGPFDVVTGDLNKDGLPDIAVANPDADRINVLYARREGGFGPPLDVPGRFNGRSLTIADVDRDGNPDIVLSAYNNAEVAVYWGDGAQRFVHRPPALLAVGANPQGVAAGDFNVDGWPDIVTASAGSTGLTIHFHTPGATTFTRLDLDVPPQQNVVAVGDFDRDGRPDIAAASTGTSDITIVLNRRDGMTTQVFPGGGASPRGIVVADVNRDGALDLITGHRGTSTIQIALGRGDGTFAAPDGYAAGAGSRAVTCADFDNDGRVDCASANEYADSVTVLSNVTAFPRAGFAFQQTLIGPGENAYSGDASADVADFDVDGALDVVTNGVGLRVHLAGGRSTLLSAQGAEAVAAARVNADGNPDVLAIQTNYLDTSARSRIEAYLGDGNGDFPGRRTTATSLFVVQFAADDLNGDGRVDVVALGRPEWFSTTAQIHVFLGTGDGGFTPASAIPLDASQTSLNLGDVDNDGDLDLVTYVSPTQAGGGTTTIDTRLNDGRGGFGAPRKAAVLEFDGIYGTALGDVNHDGYLDVAAAGNPRAYSTRQRVAILPGGPNGFAAASYLVTSEFVTGLSIADLTLDGHADVISDGGVLFHGRGDGTFTGPELFNFFTLRPRILDFNQDGLPDIVAPEALNTAQAILNLRRDTNTAPAVDLGRDFTIAYRYQYGDGDLELWGRSADADLHRPTFRWKLPDGTYTDTGTFPFLSPPHMAPGRHAFTIEADDGRGGVATDTVVITVLPEKEIVLHVGDNWYAQPHGAWAAQDDQTAASGKALHDANAGAAKVTVPRADPASFVDVGFVADPTQTYKIWVRLKADGDSWANDSLWLQFTGAVDASGRSYAPGTASGIEVNLEECGGCGVSAWGWRDEAWGQRDAIGTLTLRFPQGGWQTLRIQTREDGVSVDQIVLSAEKYLTTRPGATKNDGTVLPPIFY